MECKALFTTWPGVCFLLRSGAVLIGFPHFHKIHRAYYWLITGATGYIEERPQSADEPPLINRATALEAPPSLPNGPAAIHSLL